jgi:hypothetical protein
MRAIWKPTREEIAAIRAAGIKVADGHRRITLEPRINCSAVDHRKPHHMNGYLVEDDIDDTDLFDTVAWGKFTKGVELDDRGRAWVDFYVRPIGFGADDMDSLLGNVTVWYEADKGIVRWVCI